MLDIVSKLCNTIHRLACELSELLLLKLITINMNLNSRYNKLLYVVCSNTGKLGSPDDIETRNRIQAFKQALVYKCDVLVFSGIDGDDRAIFLHEFKYDYKYFGNYPLTTGRICANIRL